MDSTGYMGMFREEGLDKGHIKEENHGYRVWKWQKLEKMCV